MKAGKRAMAATSYSPGTWLGLVRSRTAVLLGPDTEPALVAALWELLENRPEVHEVLHAVTSSHGGSLANIPSFGILDFAGPLRVFLRGDLDVAVQSPDGAVELNGRDVTTWTERRLALPGECRLTIPAAAGVASHGGLPELPIGEGVVLLQSLVLAPGTESPGHGTDAEDLPGITVAPEHGASAETVYAVIDEDFDETAGGSDGMTAQEVVPSQAEDAAPASDMTSSYDHLWERTVMRNIEDAAVREDPEAEHVEEAAPAADPNGTLPSSEESDSREENQVPAAPVVPAGPVPAASTPGDAPTPPAAGGLIDSVPWRTGAAGSQPASAAFSSAVLSPAPAIVSPMLAPVPSGAGGTPEKPGSETPHAGYDADHDGQTVIKSRLSGEAARPAPAAGGPSAAGPLVLARVCPQDHASPPTNSHCATCGAGLLVDAVQVARPRLGRMRISTGELVDLDQSLVIGRQPSVSRVQGGIMPRLVQVASPGGDISRSHVEVRLEGWHVMLCDLKATNGTVLVREGQPPRRLAQNEMAILLDGDIAELGDDISLRFEEIP